MAKTVTVGLIQTAVSEDTEANLKRTVEKIKQATEKGAQIVCLQELFRTRYFPQQENMDASGLAETVPGESTRVLSKVAKENNIVIIVPLFEKAANGKAYNTAVVIDADGQVLGAYRKIHVPQDPLFYEQNYFAKGEEYLVAKTRYANIGVLICYDQWFPEPARINTLMGAEILVYPTAIGTIKGYTSSDGDWHDAWKTVQRAHAIENGVHVAAVNRIGGEGKLQFWGGSFVCDSFGTVLAEAGTEEEVLVVKVDLDKNEQIREGWGFLRNRRPDTYKLLTESAGKTPRELGYHMPAEWEQHDAIWLAWPHDPTTFTSGIEKVEQTYVEIIKHLHKDERVNLFVKDQNMKKNTSEMLKKADVDLKQVRFFVFDYADVWFRDYGPIFVRNNDALAMVHWMFNSWGEKYEELLKDAAIPHVINKKMGLTCFEPGIVLEGGSIDVNGKGSLLTTEQCLLNKNRNSCLSKEEIERYLRDYLGVTNIIWLHSGIAGDDTDGHVDDLARFVNPTTVVCGYEDSDDENAQALKNNYQTLCQFTDQDGKKLKIIKLPMPGDIKYKKKRLPASYTNFYIGNKTVLVPTFRSKNDKTALAILQELFPSRKVVGIDSTDLICGFGAIHCISQQQPTKSQT
jgi:agmatine deiminase